MSKVAIVYLSWVPYGVEHLKSFLGSYLNYPPTEEHRLLLLFNGVQDHSELSIFLSTAQQMLGRPTDHLILERGQDIDAYFYACRELKEQYVLFFNSYSRLRSDRWLDHYLNVIQIPGIGAAGASASSMSYFSAVFKQQTWRWERTKSFRDQFRKYKLLIKAFCYWRFLFPPFPNPHLRTNAFIIQRTLFLQLMCPPLHRKIDAYRFESGWNSMTRQLLKKKLEVRVVDQKGHSFPIEEASAHSVFWKDGQEDLLVADNQTEKYDLADMQKKEVLTSLAWGK